MAGTIKKTLLLNIGQLVACKEPMVLRTLLGSCVSTCLFDPISRVVGMNHILLPGKANFQDFNDEARYGVNSMELLLNEMAQIGALRSRLNAKIFGGGHVLAGISEDKSPGVKNVEFVLEYLKMENIRVVAQDTGGPFTRVIHFHSDTYEVFVKKVKMAGVSRLLEAEQKQKEEAAKKVEAEMDVTLFD